MRSNKTETKGKVLHESQVSIYLLYISISIISISQSIGPKQPTMSSLRPHPVSASTQGCWEGTLAADTHFPTWPPSSLPQQRLYPPPHNCFSSHSPPTWGSPQTARGFPPPAAISQLPRRLPSCFIYTFDGKGP